MTPLSYTELSTLRANGAVTAPMVQAELHPLKPSDQNLLQDKVRSTMHACRNACSTDPPAAAVQGATSAKV